jgi:cytochrome c biogenesis protein CcdA
MAALALGLVTAFVTIGLFVATIGFSIGLDQDIFRNASAVLLAGLGIVLLSGALQARFALATAGVSNAGNRMMARIVPTDAASGLGGQVLLGLVLGAVWSPCVGPTLGAASVLASQGRDLGAVAAVMIAFGLGTALPLLAIGSLSRQALGRWRGRMLQAGKSGKMLLGGVALAVALLILSGADRALEAQAVAASPAWLTDLTTRF